MVGGAGNRARLQAHDIEHTSQGVRFSVVEDSQRLPLATRLVGDYNVANVLGVIAAMRSIGVPLAAAVQACSRLTPVPGRMECVSSPGRPLVAVDYAHTPDALAKALDALRPLAQARSGRLWCLFGCGGDRDNVKRPLMGAIAAGRADVVVVTSDNPRVRAEAARAWSMWETRVAALVADEASLAHCDDLDFTLAFARIECHYFVNHGFLADELQLLTDTVKIQHIPTTIVHGRYDVICPLENAWDLHRRLPRSELVIVPDSGHSAFEPGIAAALREATDRYR